jgi:peptidoglycan hydrolase-like protein with peptidoglycan-binding domain
MKKYLLFSILGLSFFALQVQAQTTPYQSVGSVYATPNTGISSGTFLTDLSIGSRGEDVSALQIFLMEHGYDIPSISSGATKRGYFGVQTKNALIAYQQSVGLSGTGVLGPITRGKMNSGAVGVTQGTIINPGQVNVITTQPTYRNNIIIVNGGTSAPSITGVDAPSTGVVGQAVNVVVHATDPNNTLLNFYADWGDALILAPSYLGTSPEMTYAQSASFSHTYAASGTYQIKLTVRNIRGETTQTSVTVYIRGTSSVGDLIVTSPNGGEVWRQGTLQTIRWTSPQYFRTTSADLRLVPYAPGTTAFTPYIIATNLNINQNSYTWYVGNATPYTPGSLPIATVPDGQYLIQLCEYGTNNCDTSDRPFTINSGVASLTPDIDIISPNSDSWNVWSPHIISVNITGDPNRVGNLVSVFLVDTSNRQTSLQSLYTVPTPPATGPKSISVSVPYLPAGQYKLLVSLYTAGYGGTPAQQAYDVSDGYITITNNI